MPFSPSRSTRGGGNRRVFVHTAPLQSSSSLGSQRRPSDSSFHRHLDLREPSSTAAATPATAHAAHTSSPRKYGATEVQQAAAQSPRTDFYPFVDASKTMFTGNGSIISVAVTCDQQFLMCGGNADFTILKTNAFRQFENFGRGEFRSQMSDRSYVPTYTFDVFQQVKTKNRKKAYCASQIACHFWDPSCFVVSVPNGSIGLWTRKKANSKFTLDRLIQQVNMGFARHVALSRGQRNVCFSTYNDGKIRMWDLKSDSQYTEIAQASPHGPARRKFNSPCYDLDSSPFCPFLIAASYADSFVRIFDTRKPTEAIHTISAWSKGADIKSVKWNTTVPGLMCTASQTEVTLWNIHSESLPQMFPSAETITHGLAIHDGPMDILVSQSDIYHSKIGSTKTSKFVNSMHWRPQHPLEFAMIQKNSSKASIQSFEDPNSVLLQVDSNAVLTDCAWLNDQGLVTANDKGIVQVHTLCKHASAPRHSLAASSFAISLLDADGEGNFDRSSLQICAPSSKEMYEEMRMPVNKLSKLGRGGHRRVREWLQARQEAEQVEKDRFNLLNSVNEFPDKPLIQIVNSNESHCTSVYDLPADDDTRIFLACARNLGITELDDIFEDESLLEATWELYLKALATATKSKTGSLLHTRILNRCLNQLMMNAFVCDDVGAHPSAAFFRSIGKLCENLCKFDPLLTLRLEAEESSDTDMDDDDDDGEGDGDDASHNDGERSVSESADPSHDAMRTEAAANSILLDNDDDVFQEADKKDASMIMWKDDDLEEWWGPQQTGQWKWSVPQTSTQADASTQQAGDLAEEIDFDQLQKEVWKSQTKKLLNSFATTSDSLTTATPVSVSTMDIWELEDRSLHLYINRHVRSIVRQMCVTAVEEGQLQAVVVTICCLRPFVSWIFPDWMEAADADEGESNPLEYWFDCYCDLLHRSQNFVAALLIARCSPVKKQRLNTAIHSEYSVQPKNLCIHCKAFRRKGCNSCILGTLPAEENSEEPTKRLSYACICSVCEKPVKGLISWCQACGHGGHLQHLTKWFATEKMCPIPGCNHVCSL